MKRSYLLTGSFFALILTASLLAGGQEEKFYRGPLNLNPRPIAKDPTVKYDYDIVYVRTPRKGDKENSLWTEVFNPATMDAGGDLMLLHPDGSEEVLVKGGKGSVTDPCVSLDGEWVHYCFLHDLTEPSRYEMPHGADLYKIHVRSRKVVRLTHGELTPNTGVTNWSKDFRTPEAGKNGLSPSLNMGPCPLPGGKVMFTSSRNGFLPPRHSWPVQQLFVMDEDGGNVECVGHLNLGMALHPVVLKDGRVMFSSFEAQGLRNNLLWGLWSIHPDGTNWGPLVSAYALSGSPVSFHFQTQLSDERIVWESYYTNNNNGFGAYYAMPASFPDVHTAFGPGYLDEPRNPPLRRGRFPNGQGYFFRLPFSPHGLEAITPFANGGADGPSDEAVLGRPNSPRVGKFTHPSGAPDNHLLTVWTPGPGSHFVPVVPVHFYDGGLYLIKEGKAIDEPGQMLLIKNDPKYNEQWPRALVPYKRIYGVDEPKRLPSVANDGKLSPHLPEGSPFGLVGTSSFYKRESYPNGAVAKGSVTAAAAKDDALGYQWLGAFNSSHDWSPNWTNQGSDAGRYSNADVHAVRILAMEASTDRKWGNYPRDNRLFRNHANERLRILGEIPLRKFGTDGKQPLDPDGNPDTSFLAKLPGDTVFTFQTLDKDGMVLNMAQTWHQLRPGEIRNDCGGCHAHSQKPTHFKDTAAAKPDYKLFDLSKHTPLLTAKDRDESGRKWDVKDETGLRFETDVKNVEYFRDVKPILDRSCVACHNQKWPNPAGNLVLNDETVIDNVFPGTYYRLAMDREAKFGYKPINQGLYQGTNASRYIRMFQSRRSLLTWKIYGRRTDGWSNDDFPTERVPGKADTLQLKGEPVPNTEANRHRADLDFTGSIMPPPEAVAGTYAGPGGQKIKVEPLTDEDRRTLVRWIDLGCPLDLDFDQKRPQERGKGWLVDEARPTLTMTYPQANANAELTRILIGMDDYNTGVNLKTFNVVADFAIDGLPPGTNLASRFQEKSRGVHELKLKSPITKLARGKLTVSVQDQQGNVSRIERTLSVGTSSASKP